MNTSKNNKPTNFEFDKKTLEIKTSFLINIQTNRQTTKQDARRNGLCMHYTMKFVCFDIILKPVKMVGSSYVTLCIPHFFVAYCFASLVLIYLMYFLFKIFFSFHIFHAYALQHVLHRIIGLIYQCNGVIIKLIQKWLFTCHS